MRSVGPESVQYSAIAIAHLRVPILCDCLECESERASDGALITNLQMCFGFRLTGYTSATSFHRPIRDSTGPIGAEFIVRVGSSIGIWMMRREQAGRLELRERLANGGGEPVPRARQWAAA